MSKSKQKARRKAYRAAVKRFVKNHIKMHREARAAHKRGETVIMLDEYGTTWPRRTPANWGKAVEWALAAGILKN